MSKHKNGKKNLQATKKVVVQNLANNVGSNCDEDGFMTLNPTDTGRRNLNAIKMRSSKVTTSVVSQHEEVKVVAAKYETAPMSELLDSLEELVKIGKYTEALAKADGAVIDDFVKAIEDSKIFYDGSIGKTMLGMTRKFLAIGKSFYEYDDKNREIVPNAIYDGIMSAYLKTGATEPVGIVPKGLKDLKKVSITYPTLHNNMDKAYALMSADPKPDGVKESDTIEDFLTRAYAAIGITSETSMKVEVSPKLDGVSVNGTIHDDMLINPQSRGDHDESVAIKGLSGIQMSNDFKAESDFGIQYEAFVTEEDRVKASEYLGLDRPYVSCRHAAAGIVHRLSTMEDDGLLKFLSFYPIATERLDGTYAERTDYIQNFGIVPKDMIPRKTIEGTMEELLDQIRDTFAEFGDRRESLSYAIDGMVITVVDDDYQKTIGRNDRTNKFQIALKFDPATALGIVKNIELVSGRKGYRTIQVVLEHPVFLDGVRYDHVPVLSAELFNQMGLHYGSTVRVHRVGDVIPSISLVTAGKHMLIALPSLCPDCGKQLIIRNKKLYCENPHCEGNIVGRLAGFIDDMGLVGYSDSFCQMLHDTMKVTNLKQLVELEDSDFEDAGVTSVLCKGFHDKLIKAIGNNTDYQVLGAMGLHGVGPQKSKAFLKASKLNECINEDTFTSIDVNALMSACIAAVGENQWEILSNAIVDGPFESEWQAIVPFIGRITKDFSKVTRIGHTGGDLSDEAKEVCRENGFDVVDGKSFDILITSSMDRSGGKMEAANKKDLPIFLEKDFIEQYKKSEEKAG